MPDLLADLFDEYSAWYLGLAEESATLPRSISGINPKGEQFFGLTSLSRATLHFVFSSHRAKYQSLIADFQLLTAFGKTIVFQCDSKLKFGFLGCGIYR